MRTLCVFCGSSPGARPVYRAAAEALGRELAQRGIGTVYGGASVGLMGALADAALAAGGAVTGVIPRALSEREIAHPGLTALHMVETMHERKARMAELADGFVALPGGYGTLDEFFEALTWAQLGLHRKPVGVLNVDGFFDPLLAALDHGVRERFVRAAHRALVVESPDPAVLLDALHQHTGAVVSKWLDR